MATVQELMEKYRALVEQRKQIWNKKYAPEVTESLDVETDKLTEGLEEILVKSGVESFPLHPAMSNWRFYRNPEYKNWKLDETELPPLTEEEKAVVRFIAGNTRIRKDLRVVRHHTALYRDARAFLFTYLKENNPQKFEEIVRDTIEYGVRKLKTKDHFTQLRSKEINQISLEDIEYGRLTQTPFRLYCNNLIFRLKGFGVLKSTHKANISVSREYLTQ